MSHSRERANKHAEASRYEEQENHSFTKNDRIKSHLVLLLLLLALCNLLHHRSRVDVWIVDACEDGSLNLSCRYNFVKRYELFSSFL
jgi:hypothetical protein